MSPAAGVPQRLPAHGQGGGSQPSPEQTSPGEQALTGFPVFQKSSICYLSFPDSHSGRPPRPAPVWVSLWGCGEKKKEGDEAAQEPLRPGLHSL